MGETQMIECNCTYDLLPGIDLKAYVAWAMKTAEAMAKQPGMLEFRANRNALGSPLVRTVSMWKSMEDWAKFNVGAWHSMEAELRGFATNVKVEIWGPSPVLSEPVRPAK
jgi:hypothetical protein